MKKYHALIVAALITLIAFLFTEADITGLLQSEADVQKVTDGDTIVLQNGDRVRLLSIDTPERGQAFYTESKMFLQQLVGGRKVRLEAGIENKDKYGRLLRYVFVDGKLANLEIVREGYAKALIFNEDEKYADAVRKAEEKAREKGKGIWSLDADDFCLYASAFHFNARGSDNANLNDEYVTFKNKCYREIDMTGWKVMDSSDDGFMFPAFVLGSRHTITLRSGKGRNNGTDVFWGSGKAVWNNKHDALLLFDSKQRLMLNYSYSFS